MEPIQSERVLTPQEVATMLGLTPRALRDWRSHNMGPRYYRLNHKTARYRLEDVREWLASKYVTP